MVKLKTKLTHESLLPLIELLIVMRFKGSILPENVTAKYDKNNIVWIQVTTDKETKEALQAEVAEFEKEINKYAERKQNK